MWNYFGITFFFCLFILFAGNLLDIVIKEEIKFFKFKNLNKFERIFFFNKKDKQMINVGYYLDIIAYSLFIILNIVNIIIVITGLNEDYDFTYNYDLMFIYLFNVLVVYVLVNIILYLGFKKTSR